MTWPTLATLNGSSVRTRRRQLGAVHQPVVDGRLARVAADQAVLAKTPHVAEPRRGERPGQRRRRQFRTIALVVVLEQQGVDLGHVEPGVEEVRTEHGQFLELEAEGLDAPRAGFAEAVEGDAQKPEVVRVEVIDDDAGDMGNPPRLGRFPNPVALDDRAIGGDQDRSADAEPVDAGVDAGALTLVAAAHLACRRLQAVGRRHFVLERRGEVVAAPRRGASADLGQRTLGLAALARFRRDGLLHAERRRRSPLL